MACPTFLDILRYLSIEHLSTYIKIEIEVFAYNEKAVSGQRICE